MNMIPNQEPNKMIDDQESSKIITDHVAQNPVAIFAKSYCKYSKKTKEYMNSKGIKFEALDLDRMGSQGVEIQAKLMERTGQSTVPSVWVNGKFIGKIRSCILTYQHL